VALGDADAAITTPPALLQVPTEIRAAVDVLPSRLSVPQQFVMVHRRLGRDAIDRIRAALAAFPQTEGGGAFFAKGYEGLAPVTGADVEAARPYADLVLRRLRTKE
jgi:phosphonate transport system substrate-binding protein